MKSNTILKVIPFSSLFLIFVLSIKYVVLIFTLLWFSSFIIIKFYSKKLSKKVIDDIATSISKKDELEKIYKELTKKVHPDKNLDRIELAEEYSRKINEHRYNYNELKKLEQEINSRF
jgi:sensor histidine kinase YesM